MKAILKINDKELEVDITEEELKKLEEKKPRKRWRAEERKRYYYVDGEDAEESVEYGDRMDDGMFLTGNYFQTEEEAEFHKNELIYTQMLKDYIYEHDDVKLDWNDGDQIKHHIVYDFYNHRIGINGDCFWKCQGAINASNRQVLEDAVKFIGEENVKKYILEVEEQV